jgi:hypothetical protein
MQTPCARFPVSGLPARSSVLGLRPSALIGSRVPGARYPGPGTRYQAPVFEKAAHGVCKPGVRVFGWPGSVLGARCSVLGVNPVPGIRYQVPGSWYPTPGTRDLAPDIWRNAWLTLQKAAHGVCKIGPMGGQGPILYPVPDCLTDSVAHRVCYIGLRLSKFVGVSSRMPGSISPATQRKVTE